MAAEQRRRILEATGQLIGEHGYLGFKVAELLSRAEVSLATVRKHFGSKEGCYLALLDLSFKEARRRLSGVLAKQRDNQAERVEAAVRALFELMAAHPGPARACLAEPFAAGAAAIERYEAALEELGALLGRRRGRDRAPTWPPEALELGLAAAVLWQPTLYLAEGRGEQIGGLAPEAAELVGTAYAKRREPRDVGAMSRLGQRRAARESSRSVPANGERSAEPVLGPLPAGRHGLPREAVEESQRERLMAGIVISVVKKGYAEATLNDITGEAKVSRRVFYENFGSKERCFLAAWDRVAGHLQGVAAEAAAVQAGDPPQQAIGALAAILGFLAAEPELARFSLVEGLSAGRLAMRRYRGAVGWATVALRASLGTPPFEGSATGAIEESLAGALATMLSLRIAREGAEGLPAMLPELSAFLLGPYVGHAEADRIAGEVAAREASP